MSRFLVPIGFLLLIVLFAVVLDRIGTGEYNPRDIPTEFIGKQAPEINVSDLYDPDVIVKTADMQGKVWLLNVWATWCPECWREHEYLMHLSQKNVPIVGINWRDDREEAKSMLTRMGNPFVSIGFDSDSTVAMDWGVYGAPETFLIDEQGVIRVKHAGGVTPAVWQEKFQSYFEKGQKQL